MHRNETLPLAVARRLLAAGLLAAGIFSSGSAADPVPPAPVERVAAKGTLEWSVVEEQRLVRTPDVRWRLYLEEASPGTVRSGGRETPIRQTRVRIALERPGRGEPLDIGYVQHLDNVEIAVLEPGDPRIDETSPAHGDPDNPWPNSAGFSFVELPANVDLDDDDANDLLLRYYATTGDPRARGILPIAADDLGTPRILDLSEFVGTVRTDGLHLVDLEWNDPRRKDPIFQAMFLPAEDCRFLAQLEIRGELQCDDCCSFPVYLRRSADRADDRLFRPFFDRALQGGQLLDRVRHDIALVSAGEANPELSSGEQAALARVASFFYLTGSGPLSRANLEKALGTRAQDYRSQLLLERIEDYFLADETDRP